MILNDFKMLARFSKCDFWILEKKLDRYRKNPDQTIFTFRKVRVDFVPLTQRISEPGGPQTTFSGKKGTFFFRACCSYF